MTNKIHCPKCDSESIAANKKGFSAGKAVVGATLVGGIGLLAGSTGANKIRITCLNCGHEWRPGEKPKVKFQATPATRKLNKIILIIFAAIMALIIIICCL